MRTDLIAVAIHAGAWQDPKASSSVDRPCMTRHSEDEFLDTIRIIYRAAVDRDAWAAALKGVCDLTGSSGIHLLSVSDRTGLIPFSLAVGLPDTGVDEYDRHLVSTCPRALHVLRHPNQTYYCDYQHTSEAEMDRSAHYDWFRSQGGFRYYIASVLVRDAESTVIASLQRTVSQGHAQEQEVSLFQKLSAHLSQAASIHQRFQDINRMHALATAALDRMSFGIVILAPDRRIVYANRAADAILSEQDGLKADGFGLHALHPADNEPFQTLLGRAASARPDLTRVAAGTLSIRRPSGRRPYSVVVLAQPASETSLFLTGDAAIILICDPERNEEPSIDFLGRVYGLTPAEARLAAALAAGKSPKEHARAAGISPNTVRWHLKNVHAKLDTHRQSEIVRLVERALLHGAGTSNPPPSPTQAHTATTP